MLRYWETEFEALSPGKSKSGQRVYSEHELGVIRRIKELLYEEGYTIAGAKKRLQSELDDGRSFGAAAADGALFEEETATGDEPPAIPVGVDEEAAEIASEREPEVAVESAVAPEPEAVTVAAAPRVVAAEAREERGPRGRGLRRRKGTAVPSPPAAEPARQAAPADAPAAATVDSALSQRVETLEHGLRRVLDEVRHLRGLLADPSADR